LLDFQADAILNRTLLFTYLRLISSQYMARKTKKKVVKKKLVSQTPRKAQSRPVWALIFFTIAALVAVSIFDYNSGQYNTTPPSDINAVGLVGSGIGFHGFHYLGVAVFLTPIFLLWFGVRLLIQQERGKRVLVAIASPIAILFAAGLTEWIYPLDNGSGQHLRRSNFKLFRRHLWRVPLPKSAVPAAW
jgi:hypothetical protein